MFHLTLLIFSPRERGATLPSSCVRVCPAHIVMEGGRAHCSDVILSPLPFTISDKSASQTWQTCGRPRSRQAPAPARFAYYDRLPQIASFLDRNRWGSMAGLRLDLSSNPITTAHHTSRPAFLSGPVHRRLALGKHAGEPATGGASTPCPLTPDGLRRPRQQAIHRAAHHVRALNFSYYVSLPNRDALRALE